MHYFNLNYTSLQPGVAAQPGQGQRRQLGRGSCVCISQEGCFRHYEGQRRVEGAGTRQAAGQESCVCVHKQTASDVIGGVRV